MEKNLESETNISFDKEYEVFGFDAKEFQSLMIQCNDFAVQRKFGLLKKDL